MRIARLAGGLIAAVLSIVFAYGLVVLSMMLAEEGISLETFGLFGDSFGWLSALFSGLAFTGLIITILMQRDELTLQRTELALQREELSGQKQEMQVQNATLRIQRFENTFFSMLEIFISCSDDITAIDFGGGNVNGRHAIKLLYTKLEEQLSIVLSDGSKQYSPDLIDINRCYGEFYQSNGDEFGHYYRTLYNLLKLVDRADYLEDKTVYTNLVRAQLSRYELLLLFYSALSEHGSEKTAPLVKRYNLLKHLESHKLPQAHQAIMREQFAFIPQ